MTANVNSVGLFMKKSAFTMMELVFVIVVIGIISAVMIPRYDRNEVGEAAYQVARHLRLAQHHAFLEDRFNDAPVGVDWRETMWRLTFIDGTSGDCYRVFADRDGGGNADDNEAAVDPLTRKKLNPGSTCAEATTVPDDILLWKNFGISSVTLLAGCNQAKNIAFDHLGRPGQIYNNTMNYLPNDCNISLTTKDNHTAVVSVTKETGFVRVAEIDGVPLP